ncbi:MAG TPA: ribonuclease III [Chloroflexota bacterium]|nr:ribonuclease III [Chloroflexota bacterium]
MESEYETPEWARGVLADGLARVRSLEDRLGVRFHNLDLPAQALLHRSAVLEQERAGRTLDWIASNERLEFLGDAVLNAQFAHLVFERFPDADEGILTEARSALVRRTTFALLAEDLGLGDLVYMASAERRADGRGRATVLAEAFEAVIGAVYLDQGWEAARTLAYRSMAGRLDDVLTAMGEGNPKARLQELGQVRLGMLPEYALLERRGPDHASSFRVEARIESFRAVGEGTSRKRAEQSAARALMEVLIAHDSTLAPSDSGPADPDLAPAGAGGLS